MTPRNMSELGIDAVCTIVTVLVYFDYIFICFVSNWHSHRTNVYICKLLFDFYNILLLEFYSPNLNIIRRKPWLLAFISLITRGCEKVALQTF